MTDRWTNGPTDGHTSYRDARTHLKRKKRKESNKKRNLKWTEKIKNVFPRREHRHHEAFAAPVEHAEEANQAKLQRDQKKAMQEEMKDS